MKINGYIFVLTPIEIISGAGAELATSHWIRRADKVQQAKIRELLEQFDTMPIFVSPYETIEVEQVLGPGTGQKQRVREAIPEEEWRYWVVEFKETTPEPHALQSACALIPNDFELGFWVTFRDPKQPPAVHWQPNAIQTFLNSEGAWANPKTIAEPDLIQIRKNFDAIKGLPPEFPHITRAFARFDQLRLLPRSSEMDIIGLFSVIESLVCHSPGLRDFADSLSHQLHNKLPLLRRRFHGDFDHAQFFPDLPEDTLWKKLYEYRSKIVHGEDSSLTGKLQALKDVASVTRFLRETSKRLLTLSLSEPVLLTDLKAC